MGRPRTSNRDLPPRMVRRRRPLKSGKVWEAFYYCGRDEDGRRVEIPLGQDLGAAKKRWAELECSILPANQDVMSPVFDRYIKEIIPTKAPRTQKDNFFCLKFLRLVFDKAPIDKITPQHIAQYRDQRGKKAPVRANREIALFSHIWNIAREWGLTDKENPVRGVRKNKEKPREFYADDEVWTAVYSMACQELKDAMDLAYLTGQRPADVLKMRLTDIKDGALEVRQNKTGKRLRILLQSEDGTPTRLGELVDRVRNQKRKVSTLFLVTTPAGICLNHGTLRLRFDKARETAIKTNEGNPELVARIKEFQFRDIRPKAASETDLAHASKLLGHTRSQITETVYRRVGEVVRPTR